MTETSAAPSAFIENVAALARALVSGVQTASLYPPAHPQVGTSVGQLLETVRPFGESTGVVVGVTPDMLLLDGRPIEDPDAYVSECASLLHERDIVRLTLSSLIKRHSLQSLLTVLALDPVTLRKRGGPAKVWNEDSDGDILIEQLDYHQILRDTDSARPQAAKDELWRLHLVRSVSRRDSSLSEAEQARLLEIAEDPHAIGELAADAIRSTCTPARRITARHDASLDRAGNLSSPARHRVGHGTRSRRAGDAERRGVDRRARPARRGRVDEDGARAGGLGRDRSRHRRVVRRCTGDPAVGLDARARRQGDRASRGCLRQHRNEFDQNLIRRFVQLIGIYPPGTLVHLSNKEVAVVLQVHAPDPYHPKVRVLLDPDGQAIGAPFERNLWTRVSDDAPDIQIDTPLEPAEYGIDPLRFL